MLKVAKFTNVLGDGTKYIDVKGKILKICIFVKELSPNIDVTIATKERETLFKGNLAELYNIIYPVNIIQDSQILESLTLNEEEETEYYVSKRELMRDYYYNYGSLGFVFSGMEKGQKIDKVEILYEGVVDDGSKGWNFN